MKNSDFFILYIYFIKVIIEIRMR